MFQTAKLFCLMVLVIGCGTFARGDVIQAQLVDSSLTVAPGDTLAFFATLFNPSLTDTIYLNGSGSTSVSGFLSIDTTPFDVNAPLFLSPGESSGPFEFFDVTIDPSTPDGPYAARQQVVLFDGSYGAFYGNQTWVWDGFNWTQKFPAHVPPARVGQGIAYDPVHQQVVMFGGVGSDNIIPLADTWIWDGADWTQKNVSGPQARLNHGMSWDGQHVMLFGGWVGLSLPSGTVLSVLL